MTTRWLEQLNSLQDKHGKDVSNIHVQAEKNLVKDYLVHIFLGSYFVFFVEFFCLTLVLLFCETNFKACFLFFIERLIRTKDLRKELYQFPARLPLRT